MNKKPAKFWMTCILLPAPLIIGAYFLQAFALFSSDDPGFIFGIISFISLLIGLAGVFFLIGLPVWIVLFLRSKKHATKLNR